jgi:hypothetical protein
MTKVIDQYSLDEDMGTDAYGCKIQVVNTVELYLARHLKSGEFYGIRNVSAERFASPQFFQPAISNESAFTKYFSSGPQKSVPHQSHKLCEDAQDC